VQQDIRWFEVSVHDVILDNRCECNDELLVDFQRFMFRHCLLAAYDVFQSSAIAVFIHEIIVILRFEHLNKLHNIRVIDPSQSLDFIHCELLKLWYFLEFLNLDSFNCYQGISPDIQCLVNLTVLP